MTQTQKDKLQLIVTAVIRNISKLFWIFPVKHNRIAMVSHAGTQYSCNPKYISLYLQNNYFHKFDIIFGLRNPQKWSGQEEHFVKMPSFKFFYYFCTAKVIVSNGGMPTYIPKRKKQYVINTWHGGGAYKTNRPNIEEKIVSKPRTYMNLYKTKCTDLVLSSCKSFTTFAIPEIVFQYTGEVMPCGMPRNDIIYQGKYEQIRDKVCASLGINTDREIILYAPTFRGTFDSTKVQSKNVFEIKLNLNQFLYTIQNKFKKRPLLLIRSHYAMNMSSHLKSADIIDVSDYPDTQELLCSTDILISDYSSTIWDFSLTKKPCFLYCPDIDYYMNDDRGTYTPIETWPGILCRTNDELEQAILDFDEAAYIKKVEKHHADLGSYENGTACEQVCKRIAEVCGVEEES